MQPQISEEMANQLPADTGMPVNLPCQLSFPDAVETKFWERVNASSPPLERINIVTSWPIDDQTLFDAMYKERSIISDNFGLTLYSVTPTDNGYYRCGMSLSTGEQKETFGKTTHLTVSGK